MENNQDIKKWNKGSILSIISLILAFLCYLGLSGLFDKIDYSSSAIYKFDTAILNISQGKWWSASIDLSYWIPTILGLTFLIVAFFIGIKSIKKTLDRKERGRMLGIISTTITSFVLVLIVLLNIFPL
jgi:hypothetical protein